MKHRNQALDVLRGVAIFLVLGFHYSYFHWWWQIGWTGVDLFFVLSGYLISGLLFSELQKTGSIGLKRFWIRRGFKIYPPYFILVALTAVSFKATRGAEPRGMLNAVFFLQNYGLHVWPHTWSLAVEEHFYFALPLLLLLFRSRVRLLPWTFALIAGGCLAGRIIYFLHGASAYVLHSETHLRVDSLICGVAIQYWRSYHPVSFSKLCRGPCWLGSLLVLPALALPPAGWFFDTAGLTVLYLGYGLLLIWAVAMPYSESPLARSLAWVGRHSYSIYLWHMPLWALVFHGSINLSFFITGVAASIGIGALLSRAVEFPSLLIRDRIFPSQVLAQCKGHPAQDVVRQAGCGH